MRRYTRPLLALILVIVAGVSLLRTCPRLQPLHVPSVFTWQARPTVEPAAVPAVPLPKRLGEKIIYDVTIGALRVGSAEFYYKERTELNGKPVDMVMFTTRMTKFRDTETIYSDPMTHLPVRIERDVALWPRFERITEEYDQENFSLTVTKRAGDKENTMGFKKGAAIHNAILLPYTVRQVAGFEPGWTFHANLPTQEFVIRFQGVDRIRIPSGSFSAYHFTSVPDRFEIWISADKNKIPLKIRGSAGIGYTLVMRRYIPGSPS